MGEKQEGQIILTTLEESICDNCKKSSSLVYIDIDTDGRLCPGCLIDWYIKEKRKESCEAYN